MGVIGHVPSPAQYMSALEKANRIRNHRAQLKREIRAGTVVVADLLEVPYEEILSMQVMDLVLAIRRVAEKKAHRLFREVGMSDSITVAAMTPRQRCETVARLRS